MEPAVNHVLLIGDRLPYVSALITVNPAAVPDPEEAKAEVRRAVSRVNRRLAPFEQIRKFRILERDFSIEHGELTATMKLRRSRVLENHRALIAEMYAGKEEARQITRSD
jgi:long-chain acyl-CoA synthetase